jgi:hypothetical protein
MLAVTPILAPLIASRMPCRVLLLESMVMLAVVPPEVKLAPV